MTIMVYHMISFCRYLSTVFLCAGYNCCMVGRVPLIPLFLAGNSTPTIPHMFAKRKDACFPFGCADAAAVDGRRGSNIYEVNAWLWSFGRGKPRLGGLSVAQTHERHVAATSEARRKRAAEPKRVRKTAPA